MGVSGMKLLVIIICSIWLSSCDYSDEEYVLDLSKTSTFVLNAVNTEPVSEFRLHAKGSSSAEGVLELLLEDTIYKTQKISGNVNFKWGGDWYHPNMKLIYRIQKNGKGTLKIKYKIGYAIL